MLGPGPVLLLGQDRFLIQGLLGESERRPEIQQSQVSETQGPHSLLLLCLNPTGMSTPGHDPH